MTTSSANRSTLWRVADWIFRILLGLAFLASGAQKLLGVEAMVEVFDQVGVGQWFRIVTGLLEVGGGLLLLVPRTAVYGAGLLAFVMVGAVAAHLGPVVGPPWPALVLLVLLLVVLWMRRDMFALR